jgi:uncharacterized membrane protein YdjX (TVP38/TMEM64 family)
MRLPLSKPRVRLFALAVTAGALFALAAVLLPHSPDAIRETVAGWGWAAPLLFVAAWTALTPALFSGTILAAAAGLLFGPALGTALGIAGATLGGVASFAIARRLGAGPFHEVASARIKRIEKRIESRPMRSLLLLRVMPGMPVTWLNYIVGLTGVRARTFALANALGGAPRIFIYAGLGGSLGHGSGTVTVISLVLFVGLALVSVTCALLERRAPGTNLAH